MAIATFKLYKCTGTNAATENLVTDAHVSFICKDIHSTATASYPVAIPGLVSDPANYSYENWLFWQLDREPDGYIQNVKVYGDATQPDDPTDKLTVFMGYNTSGLTPDDDLRTSGVSSAPVDQHANYYSTATALAFGVQPGDSKLEVTGEETNYLIVQLKVEFGAGLQTGIETFSLIYDEV